MRVGGGGRTRQDTKRCTLLEREKEVENLRFFFLFLSFRKEMSSVLLRKIATESENEGGDFRDNCENTMQRRMRRKKKPDVYNEKREYAERSAVNESPCCLAAP